MPHKKMFLHGNLFDIVFSLLNETIIIIIMGNLLLYYNNIMKNINFFWGNYTISSEFSVLATDVETITTARATGIAGGFSRQIHPD
jgi:hypothetical protein